MHEAPHPRPTEIEVKLLLPPGAEAALEAHPAIAAAGPPRWSDETTTYYDTPARDLAALGASLRLRRRGDRVVQTLKLRGAADGPFARGEWEWTVGDGTPEPARLAATPVAALGRALDRLVPVFAAEVRRGLRRLRVDGAEIELVVDLGRIQAGAAEEAIREVELELISGDPAALLRFAAGLQAVLGAALGAESKSDRGWRLATGAPRAPAKQPDIPLPRDATGAAALRRIVEATLANLLANQPAAAAGQPEGVHRMRIALRRLRAALALFRPHLRGTAAEQLDEELRAIGRVLGAARDWDVFCGQTLAEAAGWLPAADLAALRRAAGAAGEEARREAAAMLAGPAPGAAMLGLSAFVAGALASGDRALSRPARKLAPALLERLRRKALRRGRGIRHRPDEELHALRKAIKRLRYGAEALAPLHRPKRVKRFLSACEALQGRLGTINDAAMAAALARRLDRAGPAAAVLAARAEAGGGRGRKGLRRAWRAFRATRLARLPRDAPPALGATPLPR